RLPVPPAGPARRRRGLRGVETWNSVGAVARDAEIRNCRQSRRISHAGGAKRINLRHVVHVLLPPFMSAPDPAARHGAPLTRLALAIVVLLVVYASLYPFTGWVD